MGKSLYSKHYFDNININIMSQEKDLKALRDAIISAENSLRTAKHLLGAIMGTKIDDSLNFEASGKSYSE